MFPPIRLGRPQQRGALIILLALNALLQPRGGAACPSTASTLADMKSGIDCGGDGACTVGAATVGAYTFNDPAETNAALGSTGTFTVTVTCGAIAGATCTPASTTTSSCTGCAGSLTVNVAGTPDPGLSCDSTVSPDGLTYTATGGGTCTVEAVCSHGFYDGQTFTAATGATALGLVKLDLKKNSAVVDTASGLSSASSNGYLIDHDSTSTASNGVISITGLKLVKTAAFTNAFTLEFTALGSATDATPTATGSFKVRPDSVAYAWGSTPTAFTAADPATHTISQSITLSLKDAASDTCTGVLAADVIDALVALQVGQTGGAQDSSSTAAWADVADQTKLVSAASLTSLKCTFADGGTCLIASSDLTILQHAGVYYRLSFTDATAWTTGTFTAAQTSSFRLDPAALLVNVGDAAYAPTVVKVDGTPSDTLDSDGFHTAIQVKLVDPATTGVATLAACTGCMVARLVKCDDNVPVASGATNYEYYHTTTPCAAVTQAACATSSGSCSSSDTTTADGVWKNTLASTTASTTADVVAGVATFANLQAKYVLGAGYRLQFTLNPSSATAAAPDSVHSNARGQQTCPNAADTVTSLVVRPYEVSLVQSPGGDGVDLLSGGDGVTGTPDGVGAGMVFRVQPAVLLKGNGYTFTESWGVHGHVPITAAVKASSCTQGGCAASCAAADCVSGASVTLTAEDTATSGVSPQYLTAVSATSDDTLSSTFSGTASGTVDVQARYIASVGGVGYVWRDLKATTSLNGGNENVLLQVMVGLGCELVASAGTKCTVVDTLPFDIFTAPEPPLNLRVVPYNSLGFRLEFDPGTVTRLKPLSGFIVEVDVCTQSGTAYNDGNSSLACPTTSAVYPSTDGLESELGSDYTTGGGLIQEVFASWSPTTAGQKAAGTITFTPPRRLEHGDSVVIPLGAPGRVSDPAVTTCTPEGDASSWFDLGIASQASEVTLTVKSGVTVLRGTPVSLTLPTGCSIYNPALKGDSGADAAYFTAIGDTAASSFGTNDLSGTVSPAVLAPALPTFIVSNLLGYGFNGTAGRFDNCLGAGCDAFGASTHFALRTIQDASSMDTAWSGDLRYDSEGGLCATSASTGTGTFPSNRLCASYAWTGYQSGHDAGDNGAPIGTNPGQGSTTYGQSMGSINDACRDGSTNRNPCALTVGAQWTVGIALSGYDGASPTTFVLTFRHRRAIQAGSTIAVPLASDAYTSGPTGTSTVITSGDTRVAASPITTWTAAYAAGVLTLTVVGEVSYGSRTTVIFRNGEGTSSFLYPATTTGDAAGATVPSAVGSPLADYAVSTTAKGIVEGSVYSFRVYAYNGRFKSDPITASVQARAVTAPAPVAYVPRQSSETMGVSITYSTADFATAVTLGLAFTPRVTLGEGMRVSMVLPGFTHGDGAAFVTIGTAHIESGTGTSPNFAASGSADTVFEQASWTQNTSTLVLTVKAGASIPANDEKSVFVLSTAGIQTPPSTGPAVPGHVNADVTALRLDWLSPFPKKTSPRLGFLVQYTTDVSFAEDVQTVDFPEQLASGVTDEALLTYLVSDLDTSTTSVTLPAETYSGEHSHLAGKYIKIDTEIMLVTSVSTPTLTVERGRVDTGAGAHPVAVGTPTSDATPCACSAGVSSAGGGSCGCTQIYLVYVGATTPGRNDGKDSKVAAGCDIRGATCNPNNYDFALSTNNPGFRTHQTGRISHGVNDKVDWVSGGCGGSCDTISMQTGREFGNPTFYPAQATVSEPGNPNDMPKVAATTVSAGVTTGTGYSSLNLTASSKTILVASSTDLLQRFVKIDDEFLYVERLTSGVATISFANSPGAGCTLGDGTLIETSSSGRGFAGTYEVNSTDGTILSISIINTGTGYRAGPPQISLNPSATCTTYPTFAITLSSNVLVVQRGSFGSTAALHDAGAAVYKLWWPTQGTAIAPGKQYYFRTAAYNAAGFSAWKYYSIGFNAHDPTNIPTRGFVEVEFAVEGMGITKANHSVWFGHQNPDGSPDWSRSKECSSITILDVAGTRLNCRAPAWDGKQHDVFLRYYDGLIERIRWISGGIRYFPPDVTTVAPALVPSRGVVTVTIFGNDFSTATANRSAYLDAGVGSNGIVPCIPLVYAGANELRCTLNPKASQTLTGYMVVSVGSPDIGGAQLSTQNVKSQISVIPDPVESTATIAKDIAEIPENSTERAAFIAQFIADVVVAVNGAITADQIEITSITAGSVVVAFIIRPNPNSVTAQTPAQIAANIAQQATDPTSLLLSGSVTSGVTGVTVPPGVIAAAAAAAGATATATAQPSYFTQCVPRTFKSFDMETCFDCCTLKCETGNEIPAVGGVPVQAGYRAQACQTQCLNHCGYNIPVSTLNTMV